jgi:hypothetical protein
MAPRYPCPNCGHLRNGPEASCVECLYPRHKKQVDDRVRFLQHKHPPFQFHIRSLIAVTIVAVIACAVTKNWGLDGLWLSIQILMFFFPAIEFFYYFGSTFGHQNRMLSKSTRIDSGSCIPTIQIIRIVNNKDETNDWSQVLDHVF